jgi:hypothetical protein
MSVTGSVYASIYPYFREAGIVPKTPAVWGKWLGDLIVVGDATAGTYSGTIFSILPGRIGRANLWTVDYFACWSSGALVTPNGTLDIYTGERGNAYTPYMIRRHLTMSGTSGCITGLYPIFPDDLYFQIGQPGMQVAFTISPNTNGVNMSFSAGGRLLDERYI